MTMEKSIQRLAGDILLILELLDKTREIGK